MYITLQKFGKIFLKEILLSLRQYYCFTVFLIKEIIFYEKYSTNSNIVKYYYNLK